VASGFLILADGRCFAPVWKVYDAVLRSVVEQLNDSTPARALREWLLSQLPGPNDIELGYGTWLRAGDEELIPRYLDVRELTPQNQELFHDAALIAAGHAQALEVPIRPDSHEEALIYLADLIARADRGEPPLSRSMCRVVMPCEGRKTGPGW
jgi:hypothetical protein